MKTVILISGYKGSGKDTAAEWLVENKGYTRMSFAAALKDEVAVDYEIERASLDDQSLKERPLLKFPVVCPDATSAAFNMWFSGELVFSDGTKIKSVTKYKINKGRFIALRDGTWENLYHTRRSIMIMHGALKRAINPYYWVDAVMEEVKPGMKVVISDWRFRNELDAVADYIDGSDKLKTVRILRNKNTSLDASENDLNEAIVDVTIDNTGSLENLYKQLENL